MKQILFFVINFIQIFANDEEYPWEHYVTASTNDLRRLFEKELLLIRYSINLRLRMTRSGALRCSYEKHGAGYNL